MGQNVNWNANHTGDETCPVKPLHDPCHTGCSEDGRTLADINPHKLITEWQNQLKVLNSLRRIVVADDAMPMSLRFDNSDPVAECLVRIPVSLMNSTLYPPGTTPRCGWHAHGDSVRDAINAWADHLARDHRDHWPQ